jgi:hypothetical protein
MQIEKEKTENMETENGMVYVLTNAAMPGIVKIGLTTRDKIDNRLKELFKTNVPVPFKCEFACKVDDCRKVESALQIAFRPYRFPQREFFKIDPDQAIAILKLLEIREITDEINQEIKESTTKEERDAGEKLEKQRRPPLNFKDMDILIGSLLKFTEDDSEVEVVGDKKVKYLGETYSLTSLTKKLLKLEYAVQPTGYWLFNGKNLKEIYEETYVIND